MQNPKLRKIILKLDDGSMFSWYPKDIKKIVFHEGWIIINEEYFEKEDCNYRQWRRFINQLVRIFEIEEFDYEV